MDIVPNLLGSFCLIGGGEKEVKFEEDKDDDKHFLQRRIIYD